MILYLYWSILYCSVQGTPWVLTPTPPKTVQSSVLCTPALCHSWNFQAGKGHRTLQQCAVQGGVGRWWRAASVSGLEYWDEKRFMLPWRLPCRALVSNLCLYAFHEPIFRPKLSALPYLPCTAHCEVQCSALYSAH